MRILPRILLHLTITLLLLTAAFYGLAIQWDAVTEMQGILDQGRESFQGMEILWSRFEALNTAWKVVSISDKGKRKKKSAGIAGTMDAVEAEYEDNAFQDQVSRDVAKAEELYGHLRDSIELTSKLSHSGARPDALPLLDGLFGRREAATAEREVTTGGGGVPSTAGGQTPDESLQKMDGIDRPLRAGLTPWSEANANRVREEMKKAYDYLDSEWRHERDAAVRKARRAKMLGLTSLLITAPLTIFSSLFLIRAIRKPLKRLMRATEQVAAGRFDIALPATGRDEISRLAKAFNRMSRELAKAKRREADFLSIAAHELKTPLTLIRVFAGKVRSFLGTGSEQAEATAHLARIDAEVDQLSRRVRDLLDLGVMEAGQLTLDLQELPAKGFLSMAAGAFKPVAAEKKIRYEISIAPNVPSLEFDPDRMNQVLRNLLDNAFKFTPSGGRVHFVAKAVDSRLEIKVSDTGPGIPPEQIEEIFEKYARARDVRGRRQTKGTGLGLAVARGIVTAHGGTIEASSAPGEGCSFLVCLPLKAGHRSKEVA